ncbi:Zinc finger, C3HHypothetical protein type (RING finger) [Nesidiocoris tenuis]|uniref:RING-type domain-containing protein n=1 Tax=Nesidiocoris tenuis TaxID=355587 RepID=A0ABN7AM00_9HEMI|nr:Zinc finger, C3HHypothetical protein type (RING finger) [Nesidiocoris tenuis]
MERGRSRASTGTFIAPPPSSLARRVPPEPVDLPARRVTRSSTAAAQAADATRRLTMLATVPSSPAGRIMPGADPHLSMVVRPATIHPSVTTRRVVTVSRPPPSPAATSTAARPITERSRPTSTSSRPTSTSSRSTATSSRSTATSSRPTATNSNSTATNSSSTAASSRSASTSSRLRTAGLAVAASSNLNTTDRPTNAPRGRTTTRAPISNLVRPTRKAVAKKKTKSAASPATVPSSDEENEDDCPVCFEENANIRWVALTACGHKFCQSCIKEFKKFPVENQLCPLCRAPCAADLRKPVKKPFLNYWFLDISADLAPSDTSDMKKSSGGHSATTLLHTCVSFVHPAPYKVTYWKGKLAAVAILVEPYA